MHEAVRAFVGRLDVSAGESLEKDHRATDIAGHRIEDEGGNVSLRVFAACLEQRRHPPVRTIAAICLIVSARNSGFAG